MKDFKYSKEEIVEKTSGKLQEGEKTFSDLPQNIVVTESQFERLMEQCLGGPEGFANLDGMMMDPNGMEGGDNDGEEMVDDTIVLSLEEEDELDEIVNEAYSLISEAIKTEKITLLEQGQYNRDPGVAAGEGIENIINHVKKAWEYIKDPSTKQKLENSIVKLSNFMTKTAELMGAGKDQRGVRPDSDILQDIPYPEHETGYMDNDEMLESMVDDGSDEDMGEMYGMHDEDMDGMEEDMEEGKKPKPDYLDLDGDGNKKESMKKAAKGMSESVEKEIKLMSEQWQRVVGNAVGTAFGTALASKASDKIGLGEDDEELGTGISDDEGEGMEYASPESEAGLKRAVDGGEFYEEHGNSAEFYEVDMDMNMEGTEMDVEDEEEGLPSGDDGATDNSGART